MTPNHSDEGERTTGASTPVGSKDGRRKAVEHAESVGLE